ncbi:hypothetical protein IAR55_006600 [Kwoniella newhampshirensis]|uniref:Ribosome biogenesis protein NOP53 n=1 Tax=Kwoniella newhampshirensis TaxID=1651941 RepID=A0AAW0YFM2_9TREE
MARSTTSKSAATSSTKPYDRPSAASTKSNKGKGKALTSTRTTELGAPSTLGQASRKGKKAWRKNIDIRDEEEALEQGREEERATGGRVAAKSNDQLFTVDTVGDVEVAKRAKRAHKPLRSLAVLSERSAVPSFTARPTAPATSFDKNKNKSHITSAEKERLRRIARRTTAHSDGTGQTSASITRHDPSSVQDVWTESTGSDQVEGLAKGGYGEETIVKRKVKTPVTIKRQREIYLENQVKAGQALEIPEAGLSYNPSAESHAKLMQQAVEEEMEVLKREAELEEHVKKLGGVIEARKNDKTVSEFAAGMLVGVGETTGDSDSEDDDNEASTAIKKPSKRKTQAQRNKALKQKAIEEALKAEKEKRKLANSVSSVAAFKKDVERRAKELKEKEEAAKLAKKEKERQLKKGGEKIGKYRVVKNRVEVQLGEDLAESLRQVKPEGNLFKDRFLALQKRALVEPRVPVLPKRTNRTKEYEKHSYKRFQ